jgi:universal stress protein A
MRLLLAVHLYETAPALVKEASVWAERLNATLDLLFVDEYLYDTFLTPDPAVRATLTGQWDQIRITQATRLNELLEQVPEAHRGEAHHPTGPAAQTITEVGKDYDAILIGTHGRTGLSHLLLGSVAERVVRLAKNDVVVLRTPE